MKQQNKKSVFELIEESVIAEFNEFERNMLKKSKLSIFNECHRIDFYSELCGYIENVLSEDFEEDEVKILSTRKDILAQLYDYYIGNDCASFASYEDDRQLVEDCMKEMIEAAQHSSKGEQI